MALHSNLVGGSTADRMLHCPGSFKLLQRIPEQAAIPSGYANYGSAMHTVMDALLVKYSQEVLPDDPDDMIDTARSLLGVIFLDRVLEQHHLDDSIIPAINNLYDLMDEYGGGFVVVANELTVKFPSVPGAYGTCDLLLANSKTVLMADWKFGQGVAVRAVYKDEQGERVNPQLMFYFAGAMETLPAKIFHGKRLAVAIIQPRTSEPLTHTQITRTEVKMFIEDMDHAIIKALGKNPPLQAGEHCRWCPARPCCPEHTKPLFDLVNMEIMPAQLTASVVDDGNAAAYGEFLAKAKYLADLAADYKKQVDEQVHSYLENGGTVPGWKLKLKTKLRQWIDSDTVAFNLKRLGFADEDIWQEKLQTFGHTDKVAKKLGVKIPDTLRYVPETDETVIAPDSDPAPRIDRAKAAAELMDALKQLRHDNSHGAN